MTTVLGPNTPSYGTDDGDGDGNLNVRNVFLASSAVLSAAPGATQVRLTLLPGTANPASTGALTSIWVGRGAGAGSTNYDGNQTQILFGGSGSVSFTASATGTAAIVGSVLTVASGSNWAVGQIVTGTNVTVGTTILSLGSGSGGAGTYNLDRSSTATSTTMNGVLPVVSDWATFGAGQTFDNTKDLVAAWHFLSTTTASQSSQTFVGVNLAFDNGGADSAGTTTVTLSNTITSAINLIIKIEMQVAAAASPFIPYVQANIRGVRSVPSAAQPYNNNLYATSPVSAPFSNYIFQSVFTPKPAVSPTPQYNPNLVATQITTQRGAVVSSPAVSRIARATAFLGTNINLFPSSTPAPFAQLDWSSTIRIRSRVSDQPYNQNLYPPQVIAAPFAQYDWSKPYFPRRQVDATQTGNPNLYTNPIPFAQYVWTPATAFLPAVSPIPQINLSLQTAPAPAPFVSYDWSKPYFPRNQIDATVSANPNIFQNPIPFAQYDWLKPVRLPGLPPQAQPFNPNLFVPPLAAPPFFQTDWSKPVNVVLAAITPQPYNINLFPPPPVQAQVFDPFVYEKIRDKLKKRRPPPFEEQVQRKKQLRDQLENLVRKLPELITEQIKTLPAPAANEPDPAGFIAARILVDPKTKINRAEKSILEMAAVDWIAEWERQDEEDIQFIIQHLSKL